ncbi:MAG TPA: type VI secretion system lipoprotein TssJ [Acetobacteraceae bacterium]|nr:type VI secretion system lipoprotein TssJ [Acetobacteraceae bacterium]
MGRWLPGAAALTLLAALAGCSSPPPPPTVVNLTLTATADVNPNSSGQAAPVAVRVYQLESTNAFDNAEFFPLFNDDKTALKTTLVERDDYILPPGTTKTVTLKPKDQVTDLGIFAAYQNFQQVKWRTDVPVPAHKTTTVTVTFAKSGITAKAGP